jgi:hypothetical protein
MSRATYPLKLPHSLKTAAARLAKEDGVSLNQWISAAVAQKVGAVETAAEFFRRRASGHSLDALDVFLNGAPHGPVEPGDELPEGWTPSSLAHRAP